MTKKYQLSAIPRKFFIDLPEELAKALLAAKDAKSRKEVGVEWCIHQSKELKKKGVPCLHYYTMGDAQTIKRIAEAVY